MNNVRKRKEEKTKYCTAYTSYFGITRSEKINIFPQFLPFADSLHLLRVIKIVKEVVSYFGWGEKKKQIYNASN